MPSNTRLLLANSPVGVSFLADQRPACWVCVAKALDDFPFAAHFRCAGAGYGWESRQQRAHQEHPSGIERHGAVRDRGRVTRDEPCELLAVAWYPACGGHPPLRVEARSLQGKCPADVRPTLSYSAHGSSPNA